MIKIKPFSPKKLFIKKQLNIGLVGSGKMALEYYKVIKSFNHKVSTIVTSNNLKNDKNFSRYKFDKQFSSFELAIKNSKDIDAWIICTSWFKLENYFKLALKYKIQFLIEKSMIISSKELFHLKKKIRRKDQNNFLISYNRNFYDYVEYLMSILKKNSVNNIYMHLPEPYAQIKKKLKKIKNNDLTFFMTSHWITFILMILKNLKFHVQLKKFKFFKNRNNLNKVLIFSIKKKKITIPLIINLAPNNPSNTLIKFYCTKLNIKLSPIEKIEIQYDLKKINKKNENIYVPKSIIKNIDKKFKPGIRYMYYDFIKTCVLKERKTILGTNLSDLIKAYQFCEILNKGN